MKFLASAGRVISERISERIDGAGYVFDLLLRSGLQVTYLPRRLRFMLVGTVTERQQLRHQTGDTKFCSVPVRRGAG